MISGKKILVVVPARGGSKGIKLKNIRKIAGIPLIGHAANCINQIKFIDRSIISTDNLKIQEIANQYNLKSPFIRPESLSGDFVSDYEVLFHALNEMEKIDNTIYDLVIMIQPTSPLRLPEHIIECINLLINKSYDSVWTISKTDLKFHPLKQLIVDGKGKLDYFSSESSKIIARQQLKPVFHRNGICYVMTRKCLVEQKNIMGKNSGFLKIEGDHISIDTEEDLLKVEKIYTKNMNI